MLDFVPFTTDSQVSEEEENKNTKYEVHEHQFWTNSESLFGAYEIKSKINPKKSITMQDLREKFHFFNLPTLTNK